MQMTLTARKEVIRQLIERRRRRRVARQSVPLDARPGARYSPLSSRADPLRLLA